MNNRSKHRIPWHVYLALLFITVLSIWVQGYQSEGSDHAIHIVFVQHYNNPGLYPNDLFVDTLSHYYSLFWYGVAYIVRLIPVSAFFFALFLLSRFLLFHALFLLALELFQKKRVGYLTCLLVIAAHFVRAVVFGVVIAPRGRLHGYTGPRGHLFFLFRNPVYAQVHLCR